jgi:hypothetical protein
VKILTGNDLPTGDVVWWDGNGWSRHVKDAIDVSEDGEAVQAREEDARRVNASYIVDADDAGLPLHIKDRIRAAGPTVRFDLAVNAAIPIEKV